MTHLDGGMPHLVVLAPDTDCGRRIPLASSYMVVGREPACEVRFDDPRVSRTHAALQRRGAAVYVQDLGSSGGTFVNGAATTTARELRAGDVLAFATVTARLESDAAVPDRTCTMAARPAVPARHPTGQQQPAGTGGAAPDQDIYGSYVRGVGQQRQRYLREAAATKSKARRLAPVGFLIFAAGLGLFAAADLTFLRQVGSAVRGGGPVSPTASPFGQEIAGLPLGPAGWAVAALGMILLAASIALHVAAASRCRRAGRTFP
ncbi:MAG TPA: FHA domain-containing protein [Streptosporangiaceae bacterium]|nr:FHA domain-containing protein [Streptosporangiaceae bacterium]